MKDKIVTLTLIVMVLFICVLLVLLGEKAISKYFQKTPAVIQPAPAKEYIVWMTNFSLVFSKDGKEIIYKPGTEVGFRNDGTVVLRLKETKP